MQNQDDRKSWGQALVGRMITHITHGTATFYLHEWLILIVKCRNKYTSPMVFLWVERPT